jgi:YVTN family beta-propeller protein
MRKRFLVGALAAALVVTGAAVIAQRIAVRQAAEDVRGKEVRTLPGLRPNENLLFNGWGVTPAGRHVPLQGNMPLKMVVSPDKRMLAAVTAGYNNHGLSLLDIAGQTVTQFLPLKRAWNGIAWSRDGTRLFVSGGNSGLLHAFRYAEGKATPQEPVSPAANAGKEDKAAPTGLPTFLAGIAVHPTTGKLYVCNEGGHEVWVVDPQTLKHEATIAVGMHPHSCAFGADRHYLYVTNWGGRSVSVVDTKTNRRVRDIAVGIRPNDLTLAPDGRLFVACAGDNTVHVIQTQVLEAEEAEADPTRRPPESAREIIATSLYPSSPEGSTPCSVAVSPDGKTLFVANADNNAVCVADISEPAVTRVDGFFPVGWYPTAVAVSPDSKTLFVANGKGLRSRPSYPPQEPKPRKPRKGVAYSHPGQLFEGSVSFIDRPTPEQMARYTEQVRKNSPYTPETLRRAPIASDSVIPDEVGAPCPIKYVLYIIKENRTYDQILGAFKDKDGKPAGNGDPNLVLYGEDVTPNHHQLARDYVLLDNLYCNGEVSRDGHSWCDAAIATDYKQRAWVMSYSRHGDLPGNEELNEPAAGFLWDLCKRHGVSFKCYGEGARQVPTANRGTWPRGRDMQKVDGWIQDLQAAEKTGVLPQFMIMSLGEDHTRGTTPGAFTPEASVASNDIGLGKIVAAATRSRFWKEMAIFVIEDDAQNGPDHVDAHRTVGLVISPYVKRGTVDSTLYTTASMIRTMELILGLPPLTQYDAGATPMFNCFGKQAQVVAYEPRTPKVDVNARNPKDAPGAKQSARMDWTEYDRIPEDELNRILWRAAKGPNVPYPTPIHRAVFTK